MGTLEQILDIKRLIEEKERQIREAAAVRARTHAHTHACTHVHRYARAHAHAHAHTLPVSARVLSAACSRKRRSSTRTLRRPRRSWRSSSMSASPSFWRPSPTTSRTCASPRASTRSRSQRSSRTRRDPASFSGAREEKGVALRVRCEKRVVLRRAGEDAWRARANAVCARKKRWKRELSRGRN
eukprot:1771817-Pleurochrysis_carterae.AAC.1